MHALDQLKAVCLRNRIALMEVGGDIARVLQAAERLEAAGGIPEPFLEHWSGMRDVVRALGGLVVTVATDFEAVTSTIGGETAVDRTAPGVN